MNIQAQEIIHSRNWKLRLDSLCERWTNFWRIVTPLASVSWFNLECVWKNPYKTRKINKSNRRKSLLVLWFQWCAIWITQRGSSWWCFIIAYELSGNVTGENFYNFFFCQFSWKSEWKTSESQHDANHLRISQEHLLCKQHKWRWKNLSIERQAKKFCWLFHWFFSSSDFSSFLSLPIVDFSPMAFLLYYSRRKTTRKTVRIEEFFSSISFASFFILQFSFDSFFASSFRMNFPAFFPPIVGTVIGEHVCEMLTCK